MPRAMYSSVMGWMVSLTTILSTSARAEMPKRKIPARRTGAMRERRLVFMRQESRTGILKPVDQTSPKIFLLLFAGCGRNFLRRARSSRRDCRAGIGPARQVSAPGDEAGSALVCDIRPRPLNENQDAIAEADEKKNVDEKPRQPGDESGDVNLAELRDGSCAADGGEAAFVEVMEWSGGVKTPILSRRMREGWGTRFDLSADHFCSVAAFLYGDGGDSGQRLALLVLQRCEVADNEDFGMAGESEIGLHKYAAGAIDGRSQAFAERRGGDSGGPQDYGRIEPGRAHIDGSGFHVSDQGRGAHFYAEMFEVFLGAPREIFSIGGKNPRTAFEQEDVRHLGIDGAKFVSQGVAADFSERAGQFHAGGSAANYGEIQRSRRAAVYRLVFGEFKGQQHAAANLDCVFDGFEAGSERLPVVVSEIGVASTCGNNQVIVWNFSIGHFHEAIFQIEAGDLRHQNFSIFSMPENRTNGSRNLSRRKSSGRHLIEQRLKCVVVLAVDQRDGDRRAAQRLSGGQAAESAADDDDAWLIFFCFLAVHDSAL